MAEETYTLTLDPNGGFIDYEFQEQNVRKPSEVITVHKFTTEPKKIELGIGDAICGLPDENQIKRPGYDFLGWFRRYCGKWVKVEQNDSWEWNHDRTFEAHWIAISCTIKWDINYKTDASHIPIEDNVLDYGSVLGNVDTIYLTPTRERYDFLGWFTHPTNGVQVNEYTQVDGDRTYYAHWSEIPRYVVKFNENGGTGGWEAMMYRDEPIQPPNVERIGYTFDQWKPEVDAKVPDHDVEYVAKWIINTYVVTFDGNGGTPSDWKKYVNYSKKVGDLPNVERIGHTFNGWWTSAQDGTQIDKNTRIVDNITFYAHWKVNQYTATFHFNDGTGGFDELTLDFGSSLEPPKPERVGYTHNGWNPEVPATMPPKDTEYLAQWKANEYTITFDANGGQGRMSSMMKYGDKLTPPEVNRIGYSFIEWMPHVPDTVPPEDTTYVAQWNTNRYRVVFDANGGIGGEVQIIDFGSKIVPPTVVRDGYEFIEWLPKVPDTVPAEETVCYAQWQKIEEPDPEQDRYTITEDGIYDIILSGGEDDGSFLDYDDD